MAEAELHAKTTFRTKKGFLSATPFIQKLDFLIEVDWSGDKLIKEGNVVEVERLTKIIFFLEGGSRNKLIKKGNV